MKVYDLQEITDSRVLYDKNPPKFMVYIILLVVAVAAGFLATSVVSGLELFLNFSLGQGIARAVDRLDRHRNNGLIEL